MTDTLAAEHVSADVPEYPMEREARCPFAPPLQMLEMGEAETAVAGADLERHHARG